MLATRKTRVTATLDGVNYTVAVADCLGWIDSTEQLLRSESRDVLPRRSSPHGGGQRCNENARQLPFVQFHQKHAEFPTVRHSLPARTASTTFLYSYSTPLVMTSPLIRERLRRQQRNTSCRDSAVDAKASFTSHELNP